MPDLYSLPCVSTHLLVGPLSHFPLLYTLKSAFSHHVTHENLPGNVTDFLDIITTIFTKTLPYFCLLMFQWKSQQTTVIPRETVKGMCSGERLGSVLAWCLSHPSQACFWTPLPPTKVPGLWNQDNHNIKFTGLPWRLNGMCAKNLVLSKHPGKFFC